MHDTSLEGNELSVEVVLSALSDCNESMTTVYPFISHLRNPLDGCVPPPPNRLVPPNLNTLNAFPILPIELPVEGTEGNPLLIGGVDGIGVGGSQYVNGYIYNVSSD